MSRLVYRHAQHHVQSFQCRTLDNDRLATLEIHKLHQLIELRISSQFRFFQHIRHIRIAENIQLTLHLQIAYRSAHRSKEVDIRLAESLGTGILLGINQQEVLRSHPDIEHHLLYIRKVETALDIERTLIVGIHHEVFEEQLAVYDTDRIVGKTHRDAIRHTDEISRIQIYFALYIQLAQGSLQTQFSFAISLQTHNLVRNETVDKMQRQLLHTHFGIEITVSFRFVSTLYGSYFFTLIIEETIYIMRTVALWHVNEFSTDISHRTLFVNHIVDVQIRRNREFILGLDNMEVAVKNTRDVRHIRNHAEHFIQIKLAHAHRKILQRFFVFIIAIYTDTHAVGCLQNQIGRNTVVIAQHQIVIIVGSKLFVPQDRMGIDERNLHAVFQQQRLQTHIYTQSVFGIIDAGIDIGTLLLQFALYLCPEHILRIMLVVLNTCCIADGIALSLHQGTDRIQLHATRYQ